MIDLQEAVLRPPRLSLTEVGDVTVPEHAADGGDSTFARMLDQQSDRHLDAIATVSGEPQSSNPTAAVGLVSKNARAVAKPGATPDSKEGKEAVSSSPLAQLIEAIEKLTEGARSLALRGDGAAVQARADLEVLLARLRDARNLTELDLSGLLTSLGGPSLATADSAAVGALMQQARTALTGAMGSGGALATTTATTGERIQLGDGASNALNRPIPVTAGPTADGPTLPDRQLPREAQLSRDVQLSRVVVVDLRDSARGALGVEGRQPTSSRASSASTARVATTLTAPQPAFLADGLAAGRALQSAGEAMRAEAKQPAPNRGSSASRARVAATLTAAQSVSPADGLAASPALQSVEGAMRAGPVFELVSLRPQTAVGEAAAPPTADGARLGDLRSLLPSEVVRHTNILVREGGGEIRLVLRPESLGSVRINVSIENGSLEGRIFVENASVREVIENNLGSLRAALRDDGFEDAALDVFVGDRGTGGQRRESDQASEQVDTDSESNTAYRGDAASDIDGGYRLDDHGALAVNLVV